MDELLTEDGDTLTQEDGGVLLLNVLSAQVGSAVGVAGSRGGAMVR
jgi:hypothetical protein